MKAVTFDDLDDGSHPIDFEVPLGYKGFNLEQINNSGSAFGNLWAYSEREYTKVYGYNPNFPSDHYVARLADSTTTCNLRITFAGRGSFNFLEAKFHGIGYSQGSYVYWAERLNFVGHKRDGSIVKHSSVPITHTHGAWSTISFPDMTDLVSLEIFGKTTAPTALNAMWIMDNFRYEEYTILSR